MTTLDDLKRKTRIEIPADKLADLIRAVYDLSQPVGLGLLHYTPGPLSEDTVNAILHSPRGIGMDYVNGRQCKMYVTNEDGKHFICKKWADHTREDMERLLVRLGIDPKELDNV